MFQLQAELFLVCRRIDGVVHVFGADLRWRLDCVFEMTAKYYDRLLWIERLSYSRNVTAARRPVSSNQHVNNKA